jgi:hypothetical protein
MENGHVLLIAWEKIGLEEIVANGFDTINNSQKEIWPDFIREIDPSNDSIIWEWHAWDHLVQDYDPGKLNFGNVSESMELIDINYHEFTFTRQDWLHSNAIDYNPVLDQILLCVRNFQEIWIIDHSTTIEEAATNSGGNSGRGGNLLYRWGNPAAYKNGSVEDQQLFRAHDAKWITTTSSQYKGEISIFNNNVGGEVSLGQILSPEWDSVTMSYLKDENLYLPETFTKTISHPDTALMYSTAASSMQLLENGNFLFCTARQGYSFELTDNEEVVWEYRTPLRHGFPVAQGTNLGISENFTVRIERYPLDYPGFVGKDLTPNGYIETEPNTSFCTLVSTSEPEALKNLIRLFPNPASKTLTIQCQIKDPGTTVEMVHISGVIVHKQQVYPGVNHVDIAWLESGLYLVRLDNSPVLTKLVVE